MTKQDKRLFVRSIMRDAEASIMDRIDRVPEEWNGIEIRQYIIDFITEKYAYGDLLKGKRRRDYENVKIVRNL